MIHFDLAKEIHEERLREAMKAQREQQVALDTPPFRERLRLRLGDLLIAFGTRLKAEPAVQARAACQCMISN